MRLLSYLWLDLWPMKTMLTCRIKTFPVASTRQHVHPSWPGGLSFVLSHGANAEPVDQLVLQVVPQTIRSGGEISLGELWALVSCWAPQSALSRNKIGWNSKTCSLTSSDIITWRCRPTQLLWSTPKKTQNVHLAPGAYLEEFQVKNVLFIRSVETYFLFLGFSSKVPSSDWRDHKVLSTSRCKRLQQHQIWTCERWNTSTGASDSQSLYWPFQVTSSTSSLRSLAKSGCTPPAFNAAWASAITAGLLKAFMCLAGLRSHHDDCSRAKEEKAETLCRSTLSTANMQTNCNNNTIMAPNMINFPLLELLKDNSEFIGEKEEVKKKKTINLIESY